MSYNLLKGLVISGPTAVGKTEMSINLAKKLNIDIISADSMQIYKKMNIGTAKITVSEMSGIKHHLIDIVEPDSDYSVGNFEKDVNKILEIKEKNKENIMLVGGTGLYIRSITDGFSILPEKNIKIREELSLKTTEELSEILKEYDIDSYNEIDLKNRVRLIRAIEVCMITNQKFSELKLKNIKNNNYNFLKIFLTRDREELYNRIDKRVDIMINNGLLEESYKIYSEYRENLNKISAIGYKELFDYFDKKISLEEAIYEIKKESRRYAKRQITWFKKEKDYIIYNLSEVSQSEIEENILKKWEEFTSKHI